ncbi:F-box/kelch-repeat protein At3g06240-like [Vicia villosa]|uniref:F-box/kelch-repeat protein At3g06240-like n=1 Tax=Vicia villosa TaxID=3911 RepID=UPI00273BBD20|nr:F-box/kelch-repeat protein At3g06240-like [Vicia villosa]
MFLPHELIIEILLRLPVKSLIRFKSVSSVGYDSASVSLSLDYMFLEDFTDFEVKGSCRGFILICSSLNIYIWNPTTGVHKQIPLSPFGSNVDSNLDNEYFYGFGYDHSTEDYLVVLMSYHYSDDPTLHLEYFSLKANTWKEVKGPHFPYSSEIEPTGGCLYKGAIHWLAYRYDLQTDVIVAFDLMEKKLSYMPLPHPLQCGGLWVYGEYLSVYTENDTDDEVEIWVMKEYKVNSSWTLVLTIDLSVCPNVAFSPLCCTKSGDIIGAGERDRLVKYDKNGQFLEKHSYPKYDLICKMTMYIDSLLSLPSDGDNKQA